MPSYQDLMKQYLGDGARNTKFDIKLTVPDIPNPYNDTQALSVMCKATNFPSRTTAMQTIAFRGREINVPVATKFSGTWTCTFYNDEQHKLRLLFEDWCNLVDSKSTGTMFGENDANTLRYSYSKMMKNIIIEQYQSNVNIDPNSNNKPCAVWTLYGVYPTDISAIELSSESEVLEEFTVTFMYTYYTIKDK